MTKQQKDFALALVNALSTRRPTEADLALIEKARVKTPKMFAWCEKMACEVRKRVNDFKLSTWEETAKDEAADAKAEYGGDWEGYEGPRLFGIE